MFDFAGDSLTINETGAVWEFFILTHSTDLQKECKQILSKISLRHSVKCLSKICSEHLPFTFKLTFEKGPSKPS